MSREPSFGEILQHLLDDSRPFPARYLYRFSDLTADDLNAMLQIWPQVSLKRKVTFLEDLEDLAATDTLVSFEDLARALLADGEAAVRTRAIRLLWECTDPHLIPVYLNLLANDESEETRAAAASALGLFIYQGELEELEPRLLHQVEEALLDAARHATSPLIRRRALEALGTSSRSEVVELIEAAYHRPEPEWVVSALFAMGKSCDTRWEKQVLSQLDNPNDEIRNEAIRAAGELELASARRFLLDQLEDEEDIDIRHQIIWALSKIGGPGVQEKFHEMLDAEMDDEEAEFLEDALNNLFFTEDMARFDMFDFEIDEGTDEEADQQ